MRLFHFLVGTAYGSGVYFAAAAHLAHNYAEESNGQRNMYLCRVLVGDSAKGNSDMKVPPYKDEAAKKRYDSVVDKLPNSTIFVVFYDALAYPEYVITYVAKKTEAL